MHQDKVDAALPGNVQGCTRARTHMAHDDACLLFEPVLQDIDDTRVYGTDGARQQEKPARCGLRRCREEDDGKEQRETIGPHYLFPPCLNVAPVPKVYRRLR